MFNVAVDFLFHLIIKQKGTKATCIAVKYMQRHLQRQTRK